MCVYLTLDPVYSEWVEGVMHSVKTLSSNLISLFQVLILQIVRSLFDAKIH